MAAALSRGHITYHQSDGGAVGCWLLVVVGVATAAAAAAAAVGTVLGWAAAGADHT